MPSLTPILTLIVALSLATGATARPLRIAVAADGLGQAQVKALVGPFTAATGIPTVTQSWHFSADALDLLLANPATPPDVVLMPPELLDAACRKNELAAVDWPAVGAQMDATHAAEAAARAAAAKAAAAQAAAEAAKAKEAKEAAAKAAKPAATPAGSAPKPASPAAGGAAKAQPPAPTPAPAQKPAPAPAPAPAQKPAPAAAPAPAKSIGPGGAKGGVPAAPPPPAAGKDKKEAATPRLPSTSSVQARFLPQAISQCGVGAVLRSDVLAWDRDKYPGTPSWSDFWDVAKIPGKRGLPAAARPSLEIALLADGVAPGDVTQVLSTKSGVDRAFRKLDQLKPYIVWWHEGAEAVRILASGDVLMTAAPSDLITQAAADSSRHLGIQWNGGVASVLSWAVRKNSRDIKDAWRFIGYASDPGRQAALQAIWPDGGLTKGSGSSLPPAVAAASNGSPAHLAAMLLEDDNFWRANLPTLSQRFATWLQH